MKFIDKTVVVTGSRRGIGLGIALAFAKEGANIVLNATSEISQEVLELFSPYPGEVLTVVGDISKFEVAESLVEQTIEKFSKIDVLVNNAGITRDGLVLKMKEQDFDDVIDINLKGCFNLIRFASPYMVRQKSGYQPPDKGFLKFLHAVGLQLRYLLPWQKGPQLSHNVQKEP